MSTWGSASDSTIKNVTAENVVINAEPGEEGSNVCFGAIVGSGSNNNLVDCGAQATINLTDDCYFAGIIAGNVQDDTSIINCTVDNVVFSLGYGSQAVGSIAGLIGIIDVRDSGIVPTEISDFTINNPEMITENGSSDSVDVVGDTYLSDEVREQYSGPACNITA